MRFKLPVIGIILTLCLAIVFPSASSAGPGCGNTVEPMRSACLAAAKRGVKPISCFRSKQEQARLKAYFTRIGRPGQVARGRSLHQLGLACDFNRNMGSQYQSVKRLNSRTHTGNHYSKTGR